MLEQNPSLVIEICLRYPDGYPVVRESAWMEHMGDESYSTPSAFTDGAGYCTWLVYPGLHELCVPNHTLMGSLPILALRGSGLAVPWRGQSGLHQLFWLGSIAQDVQEVTQFDDRDVGNGMQVGSAAVYQAQRPDSTLNPAARVDAAGSTADTGSLPEAPDIRTHDSCPRACPTGLCTGWC